MGSHVTSNLTIRAKIYEKNRVFLCACLADILNSSTSREYIQNHLSVIDNGISMLEQAISGYEFIFNKRHCENAREAVKLYNLCSKASEKFDLDKKNYGREIKNKLIELSGDLKTILKNPINTPRERFEPCFILFEELCRINFAKLEKYPARRWRQ